MASKNRKPPELNLISLFSGAGGLDLGFAKAGFHTIWANDFDKKVGPSYQNHFPSVHFDPRPLQDIPNQDIPCQITGVIGGPPCQSWSEAGAKRGEEDPRGQLFFEYIRIIKHTVPKFFVAENVHGLIHSRNWGSFQRILKMFEELSYNVSWKLLNAKDYGVAQDRWRIFIVGYHQSLNKSFVFPPALQTRRTLQDVIKDLAEVEIGEKSPIKNHEYIDSGHSSIFLSRNRVRSWDEPSYTILATDRHIPFHPSAPKMVKKGKDLMILAPGKEDLYRRLTIRECARIQGFPDDYEFLYTHPRHGYKMVGNAVPVDLAYAIAKGIKKDLKS